MSSSPKTQSVRSADGTEIGFIVLGTGPPLVFVHGAWNWSGHWTGVAEQLADTHACLVVDRRARGTSGDAPDYAFEREVDDIAAVLDALGPEASLLGHSSGAIYALEAARRVDVEKLVLYEPPLLWAERGDPDLVDRVRVYVDAGKFDAAATLFFTEEGRVPADELAMLKTLPVWESMIALAPVCIREWDAILGAGLSVDRYWDLAVPTLLLAGSKNLDHPSMATEELAATLPNARKVVLDGHAHAAHQADPALVANEVRSFLAEAAV